MNQLERLKGEGALKATDWAWEQGESGWVPLAAVLERHGNRLPVWRPAAAQRRSWKFYAPVTVGAVCVLLLIALGWPKVLDAEQDPDPRRTKSPSEYIKTNLQVCACVCVCACV